MVNEKQGEKPAPEPNAFGTDVFRIILGAVAVILAGRFIIVPEYHNKNLGWDLVVVVAVALVVFGYRRWASSRRSKVDKFFLAHEEISKDRIVELQLELDELAKSEAFNLDKLKRDLDTLKKRLEIQLDIEQLIIRSRESEHSKWTAYGPIFIPLVGALLGFIGGYLSHK
jgi:hypothetical protein